MTDCICCSVTWKFAEEVLDLLSTLMSNKIKQILAIKPSYWILLNRSKYWIKDKQRIRLKGNVYMVVFYYVELSVPVKF